MSKNKVNNELEALDRSLNIFFRKVGRRSGTKCRKLSVHGKVQYAKSLISKSLRVINQVRNSDEDDEDELSESTPVMKKEYYNAVQVVMTADIENIPAKLKEYDKSKNSIKETKKYCVD